jgi:hypothetical protein
MLGYAMLALLGSYLPYAMLGSSLLHANLLLPLHNSEGLLRAFGFIDIASTFTANSVVTLDVK